MDADASGSDGQRVQILCKAAAEDLRLFALLHGGELTRETLASLQQGPFEDLLGMQLVSSLAEEALQVLNEAVRRTSEGGEASAFANPLDALGADFADIYLTHRLQLSPWESPWLDEDGLLNGKNMFAVRDWYARFGLQAENWRVRGDDHLSLQLTFIAHLIGNGETALLREAGRFMDQHLLLWLPDFAGGVAQRSATPFYAGLAMLTYAYAEELRTLIEQLTGEARVLQPSDDAAKADDEPEPSFGGVGPGW